MIVGCLWDRTIVGCLWDSMIVGCLWDSLVGWMHIDTTNIVEYYDCWMLIGVVWLLDVNWNDEFVGQFDSSGSLIVGCTWGVLGAYGDSAIVGWLRGVLIVGSTSVRRVAWVSLIADTVDAGSVWPGGQLYACFMFQFGHPTKANPLHHRFVLHCGPPSFQKRNNTIKQHYTAFKWILMFRNVIRGSPSLWRVPAN